MNRQLKKNQSGEVTSTSIEWTDFTWSPIAGCNHGCQWLMPDGSIAVCYAKTIAEGIASAHYSQGFEHHYWQPHRLEEPLKLKRPAKIFVGSMADVFGSWAGDDQIHQVLEVIEKAHWHTFQILTKNAPRLLKFAFPKNVWVGASVPPTIFRGLFLTARHQAKFLERTLEMLRQVAVPVRWLSIEPLSFDIAPFLKDCRLQWAVVGAATNGKKTYQPKPQWIRAVLDTLDAQEIPVFFKGNLEWSPWRECGPDRVLVGQEGFASLARPQEIFNASAEG